MAINLRGKVWQYEFVLNGKTFRGSCKTEDKHQAQELHDRIKADAWRVSVVGEKKRRTWKEACEKFLDETKAKKSHNEDIRFAAFWNEKFAAHGITWLDTVLPQVVSDICKAEVGRPYKRSVKVIKFLSANTVDKHLAFLKAVVNAAHRDWLWLEFRPLFKKHGQDNKIVRYLEPHEFHRLLKELPPPYDKMALLAVSTGLRLANVRELRWSQVNFQRRTATFVNDEMKNGESHTVPLNDTALAAIRFQLGQHDELVFPRSDMEAIENIPSKMWQRVCKKANIKNFRWHDFRHTWASWLRQQGEGLDKIQELGGWKDPSMVQRYAHLDVKHLVQSASVIDGILNWNELNSSPQLVRKN
jgi:integrase